MNDEEIKKLIKSKVIPALRRVSRFWKPKQDAMRKQKVSPGKYRCESCGEVFDQKEISLDHKSPVVDPRKGFLNWDDYIARMLCDSNGFQVLCNAGCHASKTQIENELRKKYNKRRKKKLTTGSK